MLQWPNQSKDLNLTEMLWWDLKRAVHKPINESCFFTGKPVLQIKQGQIDFFPISTYTCTFFMAAKIKFPYK